MKFAKPQLMTWSGNKITDHNRSPLDISVERIENRKRMLDGTSRSYVVADKKSFSVSWSDLPAKAAYTVDEFWAAKEMENFYKTANEFTLELIEGDSTSSLYKVYIDSFSLTLSKRTGRYDKYELNVTMVEV